MTIEDVISVIIICVLLVIFLAVMAFVLIDFLKSREGSRIVRMLKGSFSTILSCVSPPTPLQKEIKEEERTIKQLKKQKRDMERLEALTKEREALFEDVGEQHVERVEDKYRLTFNGVEINKLFATEEEAFTYAEAASDNGYFEAEVRRVD